MKKKTKDLSLGAIIKNLFRRFWVILIVAAICGGGMYALATYVVEPKYESDVRLYINGGDVTDNLVKVSGAVLKSQNVLEEIILESDVKYNYKQLEKMISYTSVNSTNMMEITVKATDPTEAAKIADAITLVLPIRAEEVIYNSRINILQYATTPTSPTSPSIGLYTFWGLVIGVIIACIMLTWVFVLDDAIKDKEYLEKTFDLPVLARIPEYAAVKTDAEEKNDNK